MKAFEEGLSYGVNDLDSIWATYCRLTTGNLPEPNMTLSDTVPELKEYTPDMKVYDDLLLNSGVLP